MQRDDFERLYDEHAQGLFAFLSYRVNNRALAEDLLADTFEKVLTAKRRHDPRKASEKTWIYAIALNVLRDHLRRADAERRAMDKSGVPEDAGDVGLYVEHRDTVRRALVSLSEEERESIALRFGADLTVPEIATLLDEPLTTVEGRVYRALRKLRTELT